MIQISTANKQHISTIALHNRLMAAETEQLTLDETISIQGVEAVFRQQHLGKYYIASSTDKIIASCLITYEWSDWRCQQMWWLQSVYVQPNYRGQGIFKQLLQTIENEAKLNNVSHVKLYVDTSNVQAIQVYHKAHFQLSHYQLFEKQLM